MSIRDTQSTLHELPYLARLALADALKGWLKSNPGDLTPEQQQFAEAFPQLYSEELTPRNVPV